MDDYDLLGKQRKVIEALHKMLHHAKYATRALNNPNETFNNIRSLKGIPSICC